MTLKFEEYDRDGDGYLDFNEFAALVEESDKASVISFRTVERIFTEASELCNDSDEEEGGGTVNMQEFKVLARLCTRAGISVHSDDSQ